MVKSGLAELRKRAARRKTGAAFETLAAADQDAILTEIEKEDFFGFVRFLTMVGAFSDPAHGGNRDRAGWAMFGFTPQGSHVPPFGYYDGAVARGG